MDELSRLQNHLLDIYKAFSDICKSHNLRFFAAYGTALGAVRHKTIIPWDDDIDISMPWDDYNKLVDIFKKQSIGKKYPNLEIYNGLTTDGSAIDFIRIHDGSTTFGSFIHTANPANIHGIFIDIFPMCGTPNDSQQRQEFLDSLSATTTELRQEKLYLRDSGKITELTNTYLDLMNLYPFDMSDKVCIVYRATLEAGNASFNRADFKEYTETQFHDTTIPIPKGFDAVLTSIYGDYLKLPPEENRKPHHVDIAVTDLDTPYMRYRDIFTKNTPEANYSKLLTEYTDGLHREKFDILNRIPPLEARIQLELKRVEDEVAKNNKSAELGVKESLKSLLGALKRAAQSMVRD